MKKLDKVQTTLIAALVVLALAICLILFFPALAKDWRWPGGILIGAGAALCAQFYLYNKFGERPH